MGLDMYLYEEVYVPNCNHSSEEEKAQYKTILEATGIKPPGESTHLEVKVQIAYWRKFNALHAWFIGDKPDNCEPVLVEVERLEELKGIINALAAHITSSKDHITDYTGTDRAYTKHTLSENGKILAEKVLPSQSGFFFGSTDYDEMYAADVMSTKEMLDKLDVHSGNDFYYRASW